jgi:hypothetical protein
VDRQFSLAQTVHLHRSRGFHLDQRIVRHSANTERYFSKHQRPGGLCDWTFSGMQPTEIENHITSVYERALTTTVDNIEHIESESLSGQVRAEGDLARSFWRKVRAKQPGYR